MANSLKGVVNPALLLLRAVKFVADRVIVGRTAEATLELETVGCVRAQSRQRRRIAVMLRQIVGAAKIILVRARFRQTKPGVGQPIGMLFGGADKLPGVPSVRPITEEDELFR